MDLHLWEWSNAAQISSALIIAVFFAVLRRSIQRVELQWWARAWWANVLALAVSVTFWALAVSGFNAPAWARLLTRISYLTPKTAFVVLLTYGGWIARPDRPAFVTPRAMAIAIALFGLVGGYVLVGVDLTGVGETAVIAIVFGAAAVAFARDGGLSWLSLGMATRAILAAGEGVTYLIDYAPAHRWPEFFRLHSATILAGHSSFDTGAEWLIALGCVLAISDRTQRELQRSNQTLLDAQEELRRLVDRDPLTALANRRSLPQVFRSVHEEGGSLVFFDLDDFKQINDEHGHHAGDRTLRRFADALIESFRPSDAVVRYAGDEFLVVSKGLSRMAATDRVEAMRKQLAASPDAIRIRFSYGVTELTPGMHPDEALAAADAAMYERKLLNKGARA